jgi:hypothetical protein
MGFSRLTRPAASACFQRLRELSCDSNVLVDGPEGVDARRPPDGTNTASTMLPAIWRTAGVPADGVRHRGQGTRRRSRSFFESGGSSAFSSSRSSRTSGINGSVFVGRPRLHSLPPECPAGLTVRDAATLWNVLEVHRGEGLATVSRLTQTKPSRQTREMAPRPVARGKTPLLRRLHRQPGPPVRPLARRALAFQTHSSYACGWLRISDHVSDDRSRDRPADSDPEQCFGPEGPPLVFLYRQHVRAQKREWIREGGPAETGPSPLSTSARISRPTACCVLRRRVLRRRVVDK